MSGGRTIGTRTGLAGSSARGSVPRPQRRLHGVISGSQRQHAKRIVGIQQSLQAWCHGLLHQFGSGARIIGVSGIQQRCVRQWRERVTQRHDAHHQPGHARRGQRRNGGGQAFHAVQRVQPHVAGERKLPGGWFHRVTPQTVNGLRKAVLWTFASPILNSDIQIGEVFLVIGHQDRVTKSGIYANQKISVCHRPTPTAAFSP